MAACAFIGLGVMGFPMAGHLQAAGHQTTVYNRTTSRAEAWVEAHGGSSVPTPREAATGADAVMVCVGNDDDLRFVVFGEDGALAGMAEGSTLVDHTTASAEVAREIAAVASEIGVGFVDAPVSGGQAGAQNGQLSIMCGGDPDVFATVEPLIDSYAKAIVLVGDVGSGQLTKMVNQVCIGGLIQGLAEALDFSRRAGLHTDKVLWEKGYEKGCDRASMSPDGKIIYQPSFEKDIWYVLDGETGKELARVTPKSRAHNTVYGNDGKFCYLAGLASPILTVAETTTHTIAKKIGPFSHNIRPFTVNGAQSLCYVNINQLLGFEIGDLKTGKTLHRVEVFLSGGA